MKIPNSWKLFEFGKAISFNPKVQFQRGEQYMFIEMDDVNPADKYVSGKEKRVYTTGSCSKFRNDDVLFARITPCLDNKKIATAAIGENQVGFGSTEFIVMREKENITIQKYVHYLCKSEYIIQNAINSYVGASGRQRADANFIKKVIVPIPKIPEQQRIASILSAYDDLIEKNNRSIELLQQMAEQIYKEWFARMRFPGYENASFEKGVPEGWEVVELKHIAKEVSKGTKSGMHLENRFYLPMELFGQKHFNPEAYLSFEEASSSLVTFEKGDILFGAMRPYQHKVCIAPFNGITRTTSFVIAPKDETYYSYLFLLLFQKAQLNLQL